MYDYKQIPLNKLVRGSIPHKMKIFIYVTDQDPVEVAALCNRLDAAGIAFFIDEAKPSPTWWTRTLNDNCCVFDREFNYYNVKFPESFIPFVLCAVDHNENPDWPALRVQLMEKPEGIPTPAIQRVSLKRSGEDDILPDLSTPVKKAKDVRHYKFGTQSHKTGTHDYMLYEVVKPGAEHTYVVAVKDYATRGHLPFFSSLFALNSWGTSQDMDFLSHTWEMLKMGGVFDVDKVVQEAIDLAKTDEDYHPRVYLMEVKRLIELYNKNGWPYSILIGSVASTPCSIMAFAW